MILTLLLGLVVAYFIWTLVCLERNVQTARRIGVPVVRLPIDWNNLLWMILEPSVWKITDALPFAWSSYPESIRYMRRGWHFAAKADAHTRHGPVWALVSPASITMHFSDPKAVGEIFSRRRDFERPIKNYKILEVFGPCISTADTANWPRHRKALAAPFNESIMKFVWNEALRQADSMTSAWSQPRVQSSGIASVQTDVRAISLNILAATGFRKSYDFHDSETPQEEDSYRSALQTILDNAIPLMLIPYRILMAPMVPKSWGKIGRAGDAFKRYMTQMLDEETAAQKQGKQGSGGIMTSLVRALDAFEQDSKIGDSSLAKGLSVPEIFGNIFVINFAGHDTTANTLAFAFLLLASEPAVQDWVAEEIQQVTQGMKLENWTYEALFEKLLRCRAILYETLRLYPPIMALPKGTPEHTSQTISVQGRTLVIPPNTGTTLSLLACHTNPSVWPSPLSWKPSRWISNDTTFYRPPDNTYFPWSDGPQNCPGKKFAEVEFVAVLACVLNGKRLHVKREGEEDLQKALDRVASTVNDVNMEMLLRMKDADRVRLQYVEA